MTPELWLIGLGLAVLLPVVPFTLELLALRRLTTAAFGTLMSLEPAFALVIGLVLLGQVPGVFAVLGIGVRGDRGHRCRTDRWSRGRSRRIVPRSGFRNTRDELV